MQIVQSTKNQYLTQPPLPSTSFCAKKDIQMADSICRCVIREFPLYSNTKLERKQGIKSPVLYKLDRYADSLVGEIRGFCSLAKTQLEFYLRELSSVKRFMAGNCSELSEVTAIAYKLNGYKNAETYNLVAYNTKTKKLRNLDHVFVGINVTKPVPEKFEFNKNGEYFLPDRNSIISDPWAGFVDYAGNAIKTYTKDKTFDMRVEPDEKLVLKRRTNLKRDLGRRDKLFLRHKYPELANTKEFSLLDKVLWWFTYKKKYDTEEIPLSLKASIKHSLKMKSAPSTEELHRILNPGSY